MKSSSPAKGEGLNELSALVRASDRFGGGRRLLALIALGVLAQEGARPDWKKVRHVTAHGLDAKFQRELLTTLAEKVETAHRGLAGVFSEGLVEDLLQASGELPGLVITAFQAVEILRESGADQFGRWFDKALDEVIVGHYGDVTTPRPIAELMAMIAQMEQGQTVMDPCSGLGSLLSRAGQSAVDLRLHGQDLNLAAAALCRLRLYFLGLPASVKIGDALKAPAQWPDVTRFDRVLCDPPYGQASGGSEEALLRARFPDVPLRLETLFLEHCLDQLAGDGRAVVLVPYGFLFRKGRDAQYRARLLRDGRLEGVIALPSGVTPYTDVALALLVVRGRASAESSTIFVDANFLKPKARKSVDRLNEAHVQTIAALYLEGGEPDRFTRVSLEEALKQDADLQPRRFLVHEAAQRQDPEHLLEALRAAEVQADAAGRQFDACLRELSENRSLGTR